MLVSNIFLQIVFEVEKDIAHTAENVYCRGMDEVLIYYSIRDWMVTNGFIGLELRREVI
jgi:hypothetical protein